MEFVGRSRQVDRTASYRPQKAMPHVRRGVLNVPSKRNKEVSSQPVLIDIVPSKKEIAEKSIVDEPKKPFTKHRHAGRMALRRDSLELLLQREQVVQPKKRRPSVSLMYAMASILFVAGLGVLLQGFFANKAIESQVHAIAAKAEDKQSDVVVPSNTKPKDKNFVANHKVSPLTPRTITVPTLRVNARVLALGVNKEGAMSAPTTAYDTGWYMASSRPGEMGAMVIDGHVNGDNSAPGVFYRLKDMKSGEKVTIERGDGKKYVYVVKKVETVKLDKLDMSKLLVSYDTAKPGLTIITCGGTMDKKNFSYDSRTVVYAVQE